VLPRPQTAGSVGSDGRPDGLGMCCAASRAFDLASSVFAADQESSAAADSSCTGTESLLAVSVALLARATASPETPSKGQVLTQSPTVSQQAQLESDSVTNALHASRLNATERVYGTTRDLHACMVMPVMVDRVTRKLPRTRSHRQGFLTMSPHGYSRDCKMWD
jgi:hypothetical protein